MAEREFVPNPGNVDGLSITVYDAGAVPKEAWRDLQQVHKENIQARLPNGDWDRAATLVKWTDPDTYRETRINPQLLVGNKWNDWQLHRDPQVAVVTDGSGQIVGGVLTSNNSSAKLLRDKPGWQLEARAKMLIPPVVKLPTEYGELASGKRYVHLREAYAMPGLEESGIIYGGLIAALETRHAKQVVVAYLHLKDPADGTMVGIADFLEMKADLDEGPDNKPNNLTDKGLLRVHRGIQDIRGRVAKAIPSVRDIPKERVTKKSAKQAEREERRQRDRELQREIDTRHEYWGK